MSKLSKLAPLPESFMFGVATADHQCEAYDERYEDIRDVWERRRGLTVRDRATDFWHRYPEDIALAKSLGCKMFRFSIAWSRVEPQPGQFSEEAFEHYRQVIETIRSHGMEPMVTLHHFTHPIHVEARGGLIAPDFPVMFAKYATEVAKRLGDLSRYWITFNEPSQLIYGYVKPWWERAYFMPPGLERGASMADQMSAIAKLMNNLFVAHTRARNIIKEVNPEAQVGANPMLLGLPLWLQKIVDRNVTNLRRPEDLIAQGQRFTERGLLEKGKVDVVIATLTVTQERHQEVAFSEAYYQAGQYLLVKAKSAIQQPEDVAQVAVVKSSTAESTVSQLPKAAVKVVAEYDDALQMLDYEQVNAILADDTILLGIMKQHPDQYRLVGRNGEGLTEENYGAAVVKGDRALLNAIDVAVRQFKDSGAWQASYSHHFPNQPIPEPPKIGRRSTLADITKGSSASFELPLAQPGTPLRRIQDRGYLIVAVKDNVPGFGYRDPKTGEFSGLEIDLARFIAKLIFGDPDKIKFQAVSTQERLPILRSLTQIFDPVLKIYSALSTSLTSNWWHLGMAGKLPTFLCPEECVDQQDFVGFDYYWGISNLRINRVQQLMEAGFGRFSNAPVWSEVLYDMLKFHAQLFPGKEIMIVENGCVDMADKATQGVKREDYLRRHIREVQRARQDGVNVVGYVCWCITSNREWGLKFGPDSDFGVYHIDLDHDPELKRKPTIATEVYRDIITRGGV
ncbi:beta-glucosidase/6-phospho-beta-glucosidase/beta-galactosidase [Nostoc sp. PCC 7524]|uniref:family 1 glycosylhydrolase n=1 Tax=Nostoc sp. (strain ATCC 29411 / PCC 7524) TaxID=28072 RepID=UPI00029F4792|nr:family 1 glycosylhydrolase [Nostoc sp. PCC 7524]AFY47546.1 beta-glucosidase/6-phospho-beta-glucosidase/beta-galactosidase [Nostoc sp. PCC 7524]